MAAILLELGAKLGARRGSTFSSRTRGGMHMYVVIRGKGIFVGRYTFPDVPYALPVAPSPPPPLPPGYI